MAKRIVKLTESDLEKIVKRVLNEQIDIDIQGVMECLGNLDGVVEVPQECMDIATSPNEDTIIGCATKMLEKVNISNGFKIFRTLTCLSQKTGIELPEG